MSISDSEFSIHFWGVRGSIATPGPTTVRYGGNTPCVEMRCQGERIIFDGGTGIRVLGQHLLKQMPVNASIFFTHSHWDHVQGFPFFTPAFIKGNMFKIYGKIAPTGQTMQDRLEEQMHHPNFPVPLRVMASCLEFFDVEVPSVIEIGHGVTVEAGILNHPGEATGYRVSCGDRVAVYATDTEHFGDRIDENLAYLARDADVLIMDATYSDEEYYASASPKAGWGHSTWQEAIKVAEAANVKTLVIFHHDPLHSDEYLDEVGRLAQEKFAGAVMAREGMYISIPIRADAKPLVKV